MVCVRAQAQVAMRNTAAALVSQDHPSKSFRGVPVRVDAFNEAAQCVTVHDGTASRLVPKSWLTSIITAEAVKYDTDADQVPSGSKQPAATTDFLARCCLLLSAAERL